MDLNSDQVRKFAEGKLDAARRAGARGNKVGVARPLKAINSLRKVLDPADKEIKGIFRGCTAIGECVEGVKHGHSITLRKVSDELLEYVRENHPDLIVETIDKKKVQEAAKSDSFLKIIVDRDRSVSEPVTVSNG